MSYTLADIRNRVINDKLDDTSFDSTVVDNFINDTQRDIFNTYELPFMESYETVDLAVDERIFTLPADCQLPQAATITSPDGQQKDIMSGYMDFRSFVAQFPTPANNTSGPIQYWTSYAGKIFTSAPLDVDYVLELFYIKTPTTLSDDADTPEVPEEFSETLLLGAFKRVLQRNEDYDLAVSIEAEYSRQLDKMVARLGYRMAAGPIRLKTPVNSRRR